MNPDVSPYFQAAYAPVAAEIDVQDVEVEGEIPQDLAGTYVRNGPNAKYPPKGRYHWFDGDGMLHALRLEGGRAQYRNRYLRTETLAIDEQSQSANWSGILESTKDNPRGMPYKDTANTDVKFHGGSLFCLWYICGVPYRVDLETLETLGPDRMGRDKLAVSAHNKIDARTGEMMFFNYGTRAPFMQYGVVDADRKLSHLIDIELPGPRLPHDMAMTANYSILMDLPLFYRPEALAQKRWLVEFHQDMPARFGVVPRRGQAGDVRWFEAEPCYIYHVCNAWEEGEEIVMVGCRVSEPTPAIDPSHGQWARMLANLRISAHLHCWRFNLKTGVTREEKLDDRVTEFPTINASMQGQKTRYSYNALLMNDPTMRFSGLVKYDTESQSHQVYEYGPGFSGSEAPFAARQGAEGEDDGYVINYVHDARSDCSWVYIFDARDIRPGPICRLRLPQRVPLGFHACWVGQDLAAAAASLASERA